MHTSKLYLPQNDNRGANIVLAVPPEGSGTLQFGISRAGQSNQILGPLGWQSADYWFETESGELLDGKAMVHLPEQLLNHLSFSNYRVLTRWANGSVTEQTYLQGGDLVSNTFLGAASRVVAKPASTQDNVGRIVPDQVDTDSVDTGPSSADHLTRLEPSLNTAAVQHHLQPVQPRDPNPLGEMINSDQTRPAPSNSMKIWVILGILLFLGGLAVFYFSLQRQSPISPGGEPTSRTTETSSQPTGSTGTDVQTQTNSSVTKPSDAPVPVQPPRNVQPNGSHATDVDQSASKAPATIRSESPSSAKPQTKQAPASSASTPSKSSRESTAKDTPPSPAKEAPSGPPTSSPPDLNRLVLDAINKQ